jgi:hypothetical protein
MVFNEFDPPRPKIPLDRTRPPPPSRSGLQARDQADWAIDPLLGTGQSPDLTDILRLASTGGQQEIALPDSSDLSLPEALVVLPEEDVYGKPSTL